MSEDTPHKTGDPERPLSPPRLTLVSSDNADQATDVVSETDDQSNAAQQADVAAFPSTSHADKVRILEALLFAAPEPVSAQALARHLPAGEDVSALLNELQTAYAHRGVTLVNVAGKWAFRTAHDLSYLLQTHAVETRRLSKAALETLAIISYHQPVTRAEIEDVRGVTTSAGTLDILLETGWVRLRGRRRAPGRPVTYGTTDSFLSHFGLDSIKDLPGLAELKGAGLLDSALPDNFKMPEPTDVAALMPDELPLESDDDEPDELPFDEDDEEENEHGSIEMTDDDEPAIEDIESDDPKTALE